MSRPNAIAITAVSTIPARAALVANTYAKAFVTYQQNLAISTTSAAEAQLSAQIKKTKSEIKALRATSGNASQIAALVNQEGTLGEQLSQLQVNEAGNPAPVSLIAPAQVPDLPQLA